MQLEYYFSQMDDECNDELIKEDKIANKIKASQDTKSMTKKAIKTLKNIGGKYDDIEKEYKDVYGESPLEEAYHKISTSDLQNIISQIEELIDEMDHNEIDAISPDPNTYGIGTPFIGTYEGYIDLANWGKYVGLDEDDEYYESVKKSSRKSIKEGVAEIEYLTDEGYEELKQLIKKFYPQYNTVREFVDNYDKDKIEVIGIESLDEIPDYENCFEIDSWDMSQGTGNVIARVYLATNGKLYGYADF